MQFSEYQQALERAKQAKEQQFQPPCSNTKIHQKRYSLASQLPSTEINYSDNNCLQKQSNNFNQLIKLFHESFEEENKALNNPVTYGKELKSIFNKFHQNRLVIIIELHNLLLEIEKTRFKNYNQLEQQNQQQYKSTAKKTPIQLHQTNQINTIKKNLTKISSERNLMKKNNNQKQLKVKHCNLPCPSTLKKSQK